MAQFNGSWIKEMGDGLILTFDTVKDAVNCCIKLQDYIKRLFNLRIGIHEGEILIEENDIIGDDVNIASRIEPFSACSMVLQYQIRCMIQNCKRGFTSKYLGKPKLNQISFESSVGQKVEVYCITSHGLQKQYFLMCHSKLENDHSNGI